MSFCSRMDLPSLGSVAGECLKEKLPARWIRKYRPFPWHHALLLATSKIRHTTRQSLGSMTMTRIWNAISTVDPAMLQRIRQDISEYQLKGLRSARDVDIHVH